MVYRPHAGVPAAVWPGSHPPYLRERRSILSRALRPGCPRPPTRAQARTWAIEQPYDHWTVWAEAYLALDQGKPSFAVVRNAFGTLVEYTWMRCRRSRLPRLERRGAVLRWTRGCASSRPCCDKLASWLLLGDREAEAVAAYERWIARARDRVMLSNGLTWIARSTSTTDAGSAPIRLHRRQPHRLLGWHAGPWRASRAIGPGD